MTLFQTCTCSFSNWGILSKKKLGFLGYHWDEEVRAVAAVGLYQIATPRAVAILSEHKDDPSQRIREMAQPRQAGP